MGVLANSEVCHSLHACISAGYCTANNTCGGGPFPTAPNLVCAGFNPEGDSLGTVARCATNAYDNNNYLTLDFTCDTGACNVDGDCPVVSRELGRSPVSVAGDELEDCSLCACMPAVSLLRTWLPCLFWTFPACAPVLGAPASLSDLCKLAGTGVINRSHRTLASHAACFERTCSCLRQKALPRAPRMHQ